MISLALNKLLKIEAYEFAARTTDYFMCRINGDRTSLTIIAQ